MEDSVVGGDHHFMMYSKPFLRSTRRVIFRLVAMKLTSVNVEIAIEDHVPFVKSELTSVRQTLIIVPVLFDRSPASKLWFTDLLPITLHVSSYRRL